MTEFIPLASRYGKIVKIACLLVLAVVLVAGLWPFHAPRNQVTWLGNKNGVRFAQYSAIVSAGTFASKSTGRTSETIEVWLVPNLSTSKGTILSFEGLDHRGTGFMLRQYEDLLMMGESYVEKHSSAIRWLGIRQAAQGNASVFVTVTIGDDTVMYLNGIQGGQLAIRGTPAENFAGRLVLADSWQGRQNWPGEILGLALYATKLTPAQVSQHYESWKQSGAPLIQEGEAPLALYLFNERHGNVVHNRIDPTNNLIIPDRYFALHPPFLASVASDYRPALGYWLDIGVNIFGFVPFGIVFAILWSEVHIVKYPAITTILFGLLISFTIELLQTFLPTRSSGCTDLITNTLGTAIGFMIYRSALAQNLLAAFRKRLFGTAGGGGADSSISMSLPEQRTTLSA